MTVGGRDSYRAGLAPPTQFRRGLHTTLLIIKSYVEPSSLVRFGAYR